MLLEDATEGESYVDSHHEKNVGLKQQPQSKQVDAKLKQGSRRAAPPKRPEKPSLTNNSKSFSSRSPASSVSKSNSLSLPRLVNNLANDPTEKPSWRSRLLDEQLPDMAHDEDVKEGFMFKRNNASSENIDKKCPKAVSFTVSVDNASQKKTSPKPSGETMEGLPQARQRSTKPPIERDAKSGVQRIGLPPSSLAIASTSPIDVRVSEEKQPNSRNKTPPTSNVSPRMTTTATQTDNLEEVPPSTDDIPKHEEKQENTQATSAPRTAIAIVTKAPGLPAGNNKPLRGTVLPGPDSAPMKSLTQAQPSFVVPPRLLTGLSPKVHCAPLDSELAFRLKTVTFGSPYRKPTDAWRLQSFSFAPENNSMPSSAPRFVILQRTNTGSGTTGILAIVQAELLRQILFASGSKGSKPSDAFNMLRLITRSQRSDALCAALTEIICRVTTAPKSPFQKTPTSSDDLRVARIVIPCGRRVMPIDGVIADDGITEKLLLFSFPFTSPDVLAKEIRAFFRQHLVHFDTDGSGGALLLLYSAVLSRGIDVVLEDVDDMICSSLVTPDAYTSTEAIALLLSGVASSYLFNEDLHITTATPSPTSSMNNTPSMLTPTTSSSPLLVENRRGGSSSDSAIASFDETVPTTVRHLCGIHRRCDIGMLAINEFVASSALSTIGIATDPSEKKDKLVQMQQSKTKGYRDKCQSNQEESYYEELKHLKDKLSKVGSFLKTPRFPVWIAGVSENNTHFTVLYSTNIELISNWRAERLFDLFCLDAWLISSDKQSAPTLSLATCLQPMRLQLDAIDRPDLQQTANASKAAKVKFDIFNGDHDNSEEDEESNKPKQQRPPIENVLQTKWPGAVIDYLSLPQT